MIYYSKSCFKNLRWNRKNLRKFDNIGELYPESVCTGSRLKLSLIAFMHHFWKLVNSSRVFNATVKKIIDPVIQRNAFFAHSENILLAMIADSKSGSEANLTKSKVTSSNREDQKVLCTNT